MSLTESFMLPLGTKASSFILPNVVNGEMQKLEALKGSKGTLIIFMCNHCPYVIHLLDNILKTSEKLLTKKIKTVAISSNSIITHPQDGPDEMKKLAISKKFNFPYLYDETQEVAKSYKAECTPDFYLFDKKLILSYRGRYDQSRPGNQIKVTGNDLNKAVDLMISNSDQLKMQYPSMGCNIKWHP
tara:strand:+ start:3230 stop:3787 length:558 start_codon:yes stop_codon:yes gene_type:complete